MQKKIEKKPSASAVNADASTLVLLDSDNSGRDEINLAGLPFGLLQPSARAKIQKSNSSFLRLEWPHVTTGNKNVTATWEVNGHQELGLAGPAEELIYLVLLQLTRESADENGWPQTVYFSRHEVIKRCGWPDLPRCYTAVSDALARLTASTIRARYAFYDARVNQVVPDMSFHLIDSYKILEEARGRKKEGALPVSWFKWSDEIHSSFVAGHVRNLALDFLISLSSPTGRRLFRFLEKFRHATKPPRREFTIGVLKLRDRLGMTDYAYASKVREKLVSAHDELTKCGYLREIAFFKGADGTEMVSYVFGDAQALAQAKISQISPLEPEPSSKRPNRFSPLVEAPIGVVNFDDDDGAALDAACDRVFAALPLDEQEKINAQARETLPPFLQNSMSSPGAVRGMEKERRASVWISHREAVEAAIFDEA